MASLPVETSLLASTSTLASRGHQGTTTSLPKPPLDPVFFDLQDDGIKPVKDLVVEYKGVMKDPLGFLRQIDDAVAGKGWRAYDSPLGAPILYSGYSDEITKGLLTSPALRDRISLLAKRKVDAMVLEPGEDREKVQKRVERGLEGVARRMSASLIAKVESPRLIRVYGIVLQNLFARLYNWGVHISIDEVVRLREVATIAAANKQSLVFLPCHKSHLDYLLVSWLCFRLGLALPHIVAGENLNLPLVGPLLRRGGAFFIRRTWGDDELYPVVANEYISLLLERGHNLEVFMEGTRSRSGKLLPPKFGILKVLLDTVLAGRTSDVILCPVSIQYDKVIESRGYVEEMMGQPKAKESLSGLFGQTSVLGLKLGRIDVRFQEPYSIKTLLAEQTERRSGFEVSRSEKDKTTFLRNVGYRVLSDINAVSVAMPSALVATALLTLRSSRGVSKKELIRRVDWLITTIISRGGRVVDFGGRTTEEMVDRTLHVLGDVIGHRSPNEVLEPTVYPLKPFELSLYRNQIVHLFVTECLFCATLYLSVKQQTSSNRMDLVDLIEECRFLSDLLRIEFVFPTDSIEVNVRRTMAKLEDDGVISVDETSVGLSSSEMETGRERYDFYLFLLWPFIEAYWIASVALFGLFSPEGREEADGNVRWVSQAEFLKASQAMGKTLFFQGDLSYLESISTFTLQNAISRFIELKILVTRKVKKVVVIGLHPDWADEERLGAWGEKLGAFRREGKSRRTNALAAARVYDLAKSISLSLPTVEVTAWPVPLPPPTSVEDTISPPVVVEGRGGAKL